MLKRLFIAVLALAMAFSSADQALAAKKYVNGIDASYPPFAFINAKGQAEGFDIEALNWVAKKMGFEVEHKTMDWSTIIMSLKSKKIDMVCSGMSISPERAAVVTFTEPYFQIRKYLLVKTESDMTKDGILTGKIRLGVQGGTNEAKWLEDNKGKNNWQYELVYYQSAPMAIEDLVVGRIDAAAIDSAPANDAIGREKKPVKIVGEFAEADNFGIATRNEDHELRTILNEGYKQLKQDPFWQELKKKYGL